MRESISSYSPQFVADEEASRRRRRAFVVWGAVAAGALALSGAVLLAPVLRAGGWVALSQVAYMAFHAVCHQMPERSFHIDGFPLAVCARCTGLYAGAAAGVLFYPLVRRVTRTDAPARAWLFVAAVPTSVDFALGVVGLWENTHLSRFLTALLLGAAAAFYVVPGFVDLGGRGLKGLRQFFHGPSLLKGSKA